MQCPLWAAPASPEHNRAFLFKVASFVDGIERQTAALVGVHLTTLPTGSASLFGYVAAFTANADVCFERVSFI
jgi:hypothetical protein